VRRPYKLFPVPHSPRSPLHYCAREKFIDFAKIPTRQWLQPNITTPNLSILLKPLPDTRRHRAILLRAPRHRQWSTNRPLPLRRKRAAAAAVVAVVSVLEYLPHYAVAVLATPAATVWNVFARRV